MQIEIDNGSGFCFGVTTAIKKAEEELAKGSTLYCLGDIVHNGMECERLRQMGLITINHEELEQLHDAKVLLRAHGEPPATYELARRNNIEIIDATCPVVLQLQKRIKAQYDMNPDAQIVIFGKNGHAEVLGLVGQTQGKAIVIEKFDDVKQLDFMRDIYLYSQTTKSLDEFHRIIDYIQEHIAPTATFRSFDTICRQVANRMPNISAFASKHDLILFVCGRKSSNGKVLYNECQHINPNSHLIEGPEEILPEWLQDITTVGICGATSTPKWLMENCMKRIVNLLMLLLFVLIIGVPTVQAQREHPAKMSTWLRQQAKPQSERRVCAFVRITEEADDVMQSYGSRSLLTLGNIHIADIPVSQLYRMTADPRVARIEARPRGEVLLDTMAVCIDAVEAYEGGGGLPQAFTGKGVVIGSMDIGYDLTHPTFYSRDTTEYRIKCLWDMLSTDTVGSRFLVGRDYTTRQELLALGHTRDGMEQTHGTHTLGIAAGSGYDSPYQGVAPEADICMVANATSNNANLIDSTLYDRFTFATDALGFKYLFDYARSVDKPCVVTFSEGSSQDFWGYDQLYYEMLDSLVGPGRILVAAAGNQGAVKSWFNKQPGEGSKGSFIVGSKTVGCTLRSEADFVLRLVAYESNRNDTLLIRGSQVVGAPDSCCRYKLPGLDSLEVLAYPCCYNSLETCYDVTFYNAKSIGFVVPLSLEILENEAEVEVWRGNVLFSTNTKNPRLSAGEPTHNVHSPSSAPRVISVGATSYRDGITNDKGEWKAYWPGREGQRADFSSVGPTMDRRTKPDVMAPGNNIISSYSSFFREAYPTSSDFEWNVDSCTFNGRSYTWTSNAGTSSACPAVAGAIALWLQAKRDLTPEEVLAVIQRTSRHPDTSLSYPNNLYGYGEIDIYRGLLDILGLSGVSELSATHTRAHISVNGRGLVVELPQPTDRALQLRLFSLSGRMVKAWMLQAGEQRYVLPLGQLSTSVYALQLDGTPQLSGSTLIRIGE